MLGKKGWVFFRKLKKEATRSSSSPSTSPSGPSPSTSQRWKHFGSAFKWRRVNLHVSFLDDVLFKVVSVCEAVVLVLTLAFFYLFCGCHF